MTSTRENEVSEQKLLPCPHCGVEMVGPYNGAIAIHPNSNQSKCPARFSEIYSDEDIEEWNRRHTPPAAGGVVVPERGQRVVSFVDHLTVMEGLRSIALRTKGVDGLVLAKYADMLAAAPQQSAQGGWVVADWHCHRFRTWGDSGPEWTNDKDEALLFVLRRDAERVAAEDEDALHILPHSALPAPPKTAGG